MIYDLRSTIYAEKKRRTNADAKSDTKNAQNGDNSHVLSIAFEIYIR